MAYPLPVAPVAPPRGPAITWLSELTPLTAGRRLAHASSGGQFTRTVRAVGVNAAEWAVEVGQDVAERVASEIPAHTAEGGFDVLRMGTEAAVLQLLISLSGREVPAAATAESLGGLPDFVRRGVALDELLRGIQLGHSVIAAAVLDECARRGDPDSRHEQMRTLSQRMFMFFDSFSTQMAAAYREEQSRWAQSEAASRFAIAEEILRGHDDAPDAASTRLRYDLARTHIGIIVWSSARTLDADQQALYEAARGLLRGVGCEQTLVLTASIGVVWAWLTPKGDRRELVRRLAAAALPPQVHAVFGGTGRGVEGFRATHADAEAAFGLRSDRPAVEAVTAYRSIDLLSLLLVDRERAVRFARTELGPLGGDGPQEQELRRTLAAYLEEGASPRAAGERLQVSRNTVTYRIRRAQELLGRSLEQRRQQLQAALAILAEVSDQPSRPA